MIHQPRRPVSFHATLHFANGVALGPDEDSVLVVETSSVKITRHWLKGPKVHTHQDFLNHSWPVNAHKIVIMYM